MYVLTIHVFEFCDKKMQDLLNANPNSSTNNVNGTNVTDLYVTCDKYQSNFHETDLSIKL